MTDPIEMVGELESAVPGLAELRLPKPSSISRQVVEADLGVALPADSRLLCELYPPFVLGDFLGVGGPDPGGEHSWVQGTRETLEIIAEWCEEAEPAVPLHAHPAPGGLLPWADSTRGDFFLWTTNPARPQDWPTWSAAQWNRGPCPRSDPALWPGERQSDQQATEADERGSNIGPTPLATRGSDL
ncbi:SMI1/KNR4 family protein [Streptomyces althioticus]|uniref:SMI1/KNR4 family protein n=1 Tax=Streptomyces althioticus TaxID=83380 RepID=UPI0036F76FC5